MAREELNHIGPAELLDLVAGLTSEARAGEIRQHLEACGVCRAELALAESFHEQAADASLAPAITARLEAGLAAARPRATGWRIIAGRPHWVRAGLIAASLVCVLLGINALREPSLHQGQSGAMRAAHPAAEWDLDVSEPEAGRIDVAWPTVDGASEYEIRLLSAAGQMLWSRRAAASPESITLATLPDIVRTEHFLFVTVVATMTDGTQRATRPHPLPADRR